MQVRLVGCTSEYARVMHLDVRRGHFLSPIDVENEDNVCVLGRGQPRSSFPWRTRSADDPHPGYPLPGRRVDESAIADGGDRRVARFAGLRLRCLHPGDDVLASDRRSHADDLGGTRSGQEVD
ncbi:MAG: hypothetical protein Ct9H300mP1_36760 [Planctomycetaceae bacterium]|nr:MAG: hypothetical protein Ct9H300mP1_36760 [Planctomycetaceae bacterium]